MVLAKIGRTLRREGMVGLWARVRHPKRSGGNAALTPAQTPPFRLTGTAGPEWAGTVGAVLHQILGKDALTDDLRASAIHVQPAPDGRAIGAGDVLLFTDQAAAIGFLRDQGKRALARCGAVLVPSAACLEPFRQAGLGDGKLFVISAPSVAAEDIAGGLIRWLVAAGALPPQQVDPILFSALGSLVPHGRLCLGLPESAERRAGFMQQNLSEFSIFDGLRLKPGWQGGGWSHATIARAALARNAVPLLVCEDDMRVTPDFQRQLAAIETYLENTEWDVFSGLLTDVSETSRISHVEQKDGLTFVHLDSAAGMVLNLYNRRALERLAAWTPGEGRPETDTVDAWLARLPDMRVVTTIPFLARHDTEAVSTIFGFANQRYEVLIAASRRRLSRMVAKWLNA